MTHQEVPTQTTSLTKPKQGEWIIICNHLTDRLNMASIRWYDTQQYEIGKMITHLGKCDKCSRNNPTELTLTQFDESLAIIYGLRDPQTREIRYVGKTSNATKRPYQHTVAGSLRADGNSHKANWIRKLLSTGLRPKIIILQRCAAITDLDNAEKMWIAIGRTALGCRLTNSTEGGDGGPLTPEAKAKQLKTFNQPEYKARKSTIMKEVFSRPGMREKIANAIHVAMNKPDVKEKHREACETAQNRPEVKEKQREARERPGAKEKHLLATRTAFQQPGFREKLRASHIESDKRHPEAVQKRIAALLNPVNQAKAAAARKNKPLSTEEENKRSAKIRETWDRKDVKDRQAAIQREIWSRPGFREKMKTARKTAAEKKKNA